MLLILLLAPLVILHGPVPVLSFWTSSLSTYREESSGKRKHVTRGMTGIVIELSTCNKTEELENMLEADAEVENIVNGVRCYLIKLVK